MFCLTIPYLTKPVCWRWLSISLVSFVFMALNFVLVPWRKKESGHYSGISSSHLINDTWKGFVSTDFPQFLGKKPATDTVRRPYHLASTQKTSLQGTGAQSGKSGKNHHDDTCSSSPGTLSGANRRDQLSGPGPLRATVSQLCCVLFFFFIMWLLCYTIIYIRYVGMPTYYQLEGQLINFQRKTKHKHFLFRHGLHLAIRFDIPFLFESSSWIVRVLAWHVFVSSP